jgi:hypothetical protein
MRVHTDWRMVAKVEAGVSSEADGLEAMIVSLFKNGGVCMLVNDLRQSRPTQLYYIPAYSLYHHDGRDAASVHT